MPFYTRLTLNHSDLAESSFKCSDFQIQDEHHARSKWEFKLHIWHTDPLHDLGDISVHIVLLLLNAQSKLSGDHFTGASEHSVCKVVQKVWETIASGYVMLHPRRYTRYHSLIMECWECSVIIMSCIGCERGCKCRWVFATKMQNSYWEPCNFVLKSSEDKNDEGEIKHDQLGSAIRKCSYNWYKASQLMFPYATIS